MVLREGDLVPCDCIIISGEVLVDESYISGENHLQRKTQLEDFEYSKDREQGFLLYLGTKIVKVKKSSLSDRKLDKNSNSSEVPSEHSKGFIPGLL